MAKRRSDNPCAILALGMVSIAFFGGSIAYIADTRPIFRLRPDLEQRYGQGGFQARFVPPRDGMNSYVVVNVPPSLADVKERIGVGTYALRRYVELAEGQTLVDACHVGVSGSPELPAVVVSQSLLTTVDQAKSQASRLEGQLRRLGLRNPKLEVLGLSLTGAEVAVTATIRDGKLGPQLAEQVLTKLTSFRVPYVALVRITLKTRAGDTVTLLGGRDALAPRSPPRPPLPSAGRLPPVEHDQ